MRRRASLVMSCVMALMAAWPCAAATPEQIEDQIPELRRQFSDAGLGPEERVAALTRAMDDLRGLIVQEPGSPRRSKWRIDLAEMLLFDWIGGVHRRADLCAEFGWLDPEQAGALWPAVSEAVRNLVAAREQNGEAHANIALQLLWGRAIHLSSLAPDGHALIGNARGQEAAAARKKLLEHAVKIAAELVNQEDLAPGVRAEAASLAARAAMRLGDMPQAQAMLEPVGATGSNASLSAQLGRAQRLARQDRLEDALNLLRTLRRQATKDHDTGLALLSTDAAWRLLEPVSHADSQPALVTARSVSPYQELLDDEAWPQDVRQGLRAALIARWRQAYGDMPFERAGDLAPLVRAGVGEALLNEARGQRQTEAAHAAAVFVRAEAWLRLALQDQNPGLPQSESDAARWNLGWAIYEQTLCTPPPEASEQASTLRAALRGKAAKVWLDLADTRPDARQAEEAIGNAVKLLRAMGDGESSYRAAAETLFTRFPVSRTADDERFYFARHVLDPAGQWREAIDLYEHVPINHADYWLAQAARLEALREMTGKDESGWRSLERQTMDVEQAAAKAMHAWTAPPGARTAWNQARILRARAVLELGRPGEVEAILADTDPAASAQLLSVRALLAQQRWADAVTSARQGIEQLDDRGWDAARLAIANIQDHPDAASPDVWPALDSLSQTILNRPWAADLAPADRLLLAETAAEARWRGGDPAAAVQRLNNLALSPHGLFVLMEATFDLGDPASLNRTVEASAQLVQRTPAGQSMWWHAWMRQLQARDRLHTKHEDDSEYPPAEPGAETAMGQDIFLAVRQLQLRDPQLGGGPCRDELRRLMQKYQPAGTSPADSTPASVETGPAR